MPRLECKICFHEYKNNRNKRTPRILTNCGHTVCERCAESLMKDGKIICPFDRETTTFTGGVQNLHKNFAIVSFLDEIQEEDGTPQIEQAEPIVADEDDSTDEENNVEQPEPERNAFGINDEDFEDFEMVRHYQRQMRAYRPPTPEPDPEIENNFVYQNIIRALANINIGRDIEDDN
ncbi:hypothetical protein CAEBREN_11062 [Caenorhabditis brenneri]|uniref:RING-type domain-containing protein n=1 Tax=Caenorhabditis brenneri TaxID=135651 RepID=G0M6H6_CAEBE|nr:hypothetical protein CAEBREN_11062 [Caenorhabditis brenneri]